VSGPPGCQDERGSPSSCRPRRGCQRSRHAGPKPRNETGYPYESPSLSSAEPVLDDTALVGRLRYVLAHGVKEGLVERRLFHWFNWTKRWSKRGARTRHSVWWQKRSSPPAVLRDEIEALRVVEPLKHGVHIHLNSSGKRGYRASCQ